MRALVLHGPWRIAVEERPDPVPGEGELLLDVVATGICGSDIHGYTGENGRRHPGQVMGHETAGRVAALGPGVAGPPPGTPVTVEPVLACGTCPACRSGADHRCPDRRIIGVDPSISAAFADRMVVPAANVVPLPESMPIEHGALVEPLAVGFHAALRGECRGGESVLVVGGGPIGQACALAARRTGVTDLVVSEPDAHRRALLTDIGVAVIDPAAVPVAEAVRERFGASASVVLDAVGSSRSLADALDACAGAGRVVLVGMHEPVISVPAYAVSVEERSIVGGYCYREAEFRATAAWAATVPDALDRLIEGRVGWQGAPDAFRGLADGSWSAGKVLVLPHRADDTVRP